MGKGNNHNHNHNIATENSNTQPKKDLLSKLEPKLEDMEVRINEKLENIVNVVYDAADGNKKQIIDNIRKNFDGNVDRNSTDKVSYNNRDANKILEDHYLSIKKYTDRNSKEIRSNIDRNANDIQNFISTENANLHDVIDGQFSDIRKIMPDFSKLGKLSDDIEAIDGRTKDLGDQVYEMTKVLKDKNLVIKQTLPSVNHEEEALVQLAECGQKIIEQLLLSGRWYARERSSLENMAEERKRYAIEKDEAVKAAAAEGERQGRIKLVKEILKKFENMHSLMSGEDDSSKIIASILSNEGVTAKYQMGDVLEITEENIDSYMSEIQSIELGKIRILNPCYCFDGEVMEKVNWEFADKPAEVIAEAVADEARENNAEVMVEAEEAENKEIEEQQEAAIEVPQEEVSGQQQ